MEENINIHNENKKQVYGSSFLLFVNILLGLLAFAYSIFVASQYNLATIVAIVVFIGYYYMQKHVVKLYEREETFLAYLTSLAAFLLLVFIDSFACLSQVTLNIH